MGNPASSIYKVVWFRDGCKEIGRVRCDTAGEALDWAKGRKNLWLSDGEFPIIETVLEVLPSSPTRHGTKRHRVTHSLAHLEREQPKTVFVGVMEVEAFRKGGEADCELGRREPEIDQTHVENEEPIEEPPAVPIPAIAWDDVPAEWRNRIRRTPDACWLWTLKESQGPSRDIYRRMKGPIPEGATLRASCDNPRCVNPNHLTVVGPLRQKVRVMLERGAHRPHQFLKPDKGR